MRKLLVLIAAGAFLVAYTVPAIAAEWEFYGSTRVQMWFDSASEEASWSGLWSDDDLTWNQSLTAGVGANVTAGDITGGFLYWTENAVLYDPHDLVLLWAAWDYGGGTITVGKNWTPCNVFISNMTHQSDQDLMWWGALWGEQPAGIHLNTGGLHVALVQPNVGGMGGPGEPPYALPAAIVWDTDTSIPKIEVAYSFNVGPAALKVFGGYNTYDETAVLIVGPAEKDFSIDSTVYGVMFKAGLDAAYINGVIHMGTNLGHYLPHGGFLGSYCNADYDPLTDEIADTDHMGYALVVGYKLSDTLTLEAGYGALESEQDWGGLTWEDTSCAYYVNMVIAVAEGFTITPEVGMIDNQDWSVDGLSVEEGDLTYWGAKWMINF